MDPRVRAEASARITSRLERLVEREGWRFLSCYVGFESEVATEDFLRRCLARGVRVAVPWAITGTRRLLFSEVRDFDAELTVNRMGILEPRRETLRPVPCASFDAVIVPGTAFDVSGRRLGYGMGYYDRCLREVAGKVPLIGLAFACQVVECLPAEEHDVPVDLVITENKLYAAGGKCPAGIEMIPSKEEP